MNHPIISNWQAVERYQTLLQQAETERLLKQIRAGRPKPQPRLKMRLADLFIHLGHRLQSRIVTNVSGHAR